MLATIAEVPSVIFIALDLNRKSTCLHVYSSHFSYELGNIEEIMDLVRPRYLVGS